VAFEVAVHVPVVVVNVDHKLFLLISTRIANDSALERLLRHFDLGSTDLTHGQLAGGLVGGVELFCLEAA